MQHQKVGCAIGNLVDRLFGRDAGVEDDEAPDTVAAQVAQQLGQQGLEGCGRQMLAAGKRREGRVEAEAHDGCRDRRQALKQPLGQGAGGQGVGLERQVRAVRLGRRADRNHDQRPRLETRLGLGPSEVFQPDAGVGCHGVTLERNGIRWNRMRFHLIPFARTGDRGSTGHDGSG
jgi:hypothetical protein